MSLRTALALTEHSQRTRVDAAGCWGYGGAAVVTNGRLGASLRWLWRRRRRGRARLSLRERKEAKKMQMVRAGQCGRVLARLRRALACLGHTRRGTGDERCPLASTRRADSADGRPLNRSIQLDQRSKPSLTACFRGA